MRRFAAGLLCSLMFFACGCGGRPFPVHAAPLASQPPKAEVKQAPDEEKVLSKFEALSRFGQVLDVVEKLYVKDVTKSELINGALKGMLQGLDPHSAFLSADEYKEMQESTTGEFFGIGIEISMENGQVVVVSPIDDTPAFKAGMKSGDTILTINGQSTQELTLQEVVSRIRGPKGTSVELTVFRAETKKPVTVHIVRDVIPLISVKSRKLEDGYYWVRVSRFSEKTGEELASAIDAARKECGSKGIKGIVLDLRNNPGGLLSQAVEVSDLFLGEGPVVSIKGRNGSKAKVYSAKTQPSDVHVPLVVLINSGSASASEIVAGALRDSKRAVLVGERSFGKGSVQNIIPLADGSAIKVTIALYYTPSGVSIQAEGVTPDIEIPFEVVDKEQAKAKAQEARFLLRERDLNRHLENKQKKAKEQVEPQKKQEETQNEQPASKKSQTKAEKEAEEKVKDRLLIDNQLRMALQVAKGLPRIQSVRN